MKLGINLYLWADHMRDGLMPVLESLKQIGYDGVEVPIFDLDEATWAQWGQRLDDLGLQRTANTVIAPEWNPLSPDPAVRQAAYQHMQAVIDCCAAVGSTLLCGPHQVALGVFTGAGPTAEEWARSVRHLRRVAEYAAAGGGSRTVLDSRGQLPAGDLFAVTLINPGTYRAANLASQARLQITVAMPSRGEPCNPARPTLVRVGDHGFDPAEAHILAGQSIVLLAEVPARFLVELVEPAPPPHAP